MSEVPKFVARRLERQPGSAHPDANVLSAFAEGTLSGRERAQLLEHLSACEACREVVSLSLPEIPAGTAEVPARTPWLRWPMLRWAGVAAAVVIVSAAVLVQKSGIPKQPSQPASSHAAESLKENESSANTAAKPPVVAGKLAKDETRRRELDRVEAKADKKKEAATRTLADVAAQQNAVARNDQASAGAFEARDQAAVHGTTTNAAQPGPVSNVANANAGILGGQISNQQQPAIANQRQQAMQAPAAPQTANEAVEAAPAEVAQASEPAQSQNSAARGYAMKAAPAAAKPSAAPMMKTALSTRTDWRVSAQGAVERSTDGRTWHDVRVGPPANAFRSLAVVGADLWAGGKGGVLYHSADNGRTWTRVIAKSGDAELNSDIARVDFTDAQRGMVTTTSGETWVTADAGATWSVRR